MTKTNLVPRRAPLNAQCAKVRPASNASKVNKLLENGWCMLIMSTLHPLLNIGYLLMSLRNSASAFAVVRTAK